MYPATKRLTFYIVPIKVEQVSGNQEEGNGMMEFQLISGGHLEKSVTLNIRDKDYTQVLMMVR